MSFDIKIDDEYLIGFSDQAKETLYTKVQSYTQKVITESIMLSSGVIDDKTSIDVNKKCVEDAANSMESKKIESQSNLKKPWYYHIPGLLASGTGVLIGIFAQGESPNVPLIIIIALIFGGSLIGNIIAGAKNGK